MTPAQVRGKSRSVRRALLYVVFYWPGAALADFGEWWHHLGNRGPWAL